MNDIIFDNYDLMDNDTQKIESIIWEKKMVIVIWTKKITQECTI